MTEPKPKNKKTPLPNGSDSEADPDDTGAHLLAQMKRSYSDPAMPAITDEDVAAAHERERVEDAKARSDTIPPWAPDEIRREQIKAWNEMATQLINVVRTVKKNEQQNQATVERLRTLVFVVMAVIAGGTGVDLWQGQQVVGSSAQTQTQIAQRLDESAERQRAILNAVLAVVEAQAIAIEANAGYDPEKDVEAKVAALEAQKTALEAKKATTEDPAEKAEADRKIEAVEAKQNEDGGSGLTPAGEPVKE